MLEKIGGHLFFLTRNKNYHQQFVLFLIRQSRWLPNSSTIRAESWKKNQGHLQGTLPTAEIISGKNAQAFLVCGFLMQKLKKIYILNKYRVSHSEVYKVNQL